MATLLNPLPLFIEIGPDWLKARCGQDGVELPLERGGDGRLTAAGKEKLVAALKDFLKPKSWLPRARAWCAISSRGVSLRRLSLPGGAKEEFHQRLLLQIESEFPLPPDELAWGSLPLGHPQPANGTMAKQELLVAALKKDLVAEYHEVLRACGADPVFTLGSLARWNAGGQPTNSFAMLDIDAGRAELTLFENAVPASTRIIFWDGKDASDPTHSQIETLAQNLRASVRGTRLFISGKTLSEDFAERLEKALASGCDCAGLETASAPGGSAAISGLEKFAAHGGPPLQIRMEPTDGASASFASADLKKWGARAIVLLAVALLLPYAEALLLKPHLVKVVAAFKDEAKRLTVIDNEKSFLEDLKLAQPPYLDVLYVFSKSVPPGTRFDALSLNSHGEVSLRCAFHDGQQVDDFRDKLIASGFFTNVVVEEQTPTPDRQRVNVRMSALEKTAAQMQAASARLAADDSAKGGTTNSPGGPPMGLPNAAPPNAMRSNAVIHGGAGVSPASSEASSNAVSSNTMPTVLRKDSK